MSHVRISALDKISLELLENETLKVKYYNQEKIINKNDSLTAELLLMINDKEYKIKITIENFGLKVDMFSRTSVFSKIANNPLICSRKRKAQKNSPRHQSERLVPCRVRSIDVAAVSLYFTRFPEVHPSCLLNLKRRNTYMETYRGGTFGAKFGLENRQG